ncbi:MAG: extracellular solute-binding protein [Planctomycetota bacterium]
MRWIILGMLAFWGALTAFAYLVVAPDTSAREDLVRAYADVADRGGVTNIPGIEQLPQIIGVEPGELLATFDTMNGTDRAAAVERFSSSIGPGVLESIPTLVWSTDDNPARDAQCHLFRVWHLETYGEPIDIVTDPSNRDITKTVVQCVAGAGPDLIESYGPEQLQQLVAAGVAKDVTEAANARNFGVDRVFPTAVPSMAIDRSGQVRQYAFPCNIGYTVLFYHRDLFQEAGLPEPTGPWSVAEMLEAARVLSQNPDSPGRRRVGIMNLGAWDMALAAGASFFNEDGTASLYNSPEAIEAFRAFQDMMYVERVMPTPAEAASMAASGGANMNMGAEAASASALFASKVTAMYVGGRWEYVATASRNRERALVPAARRRIAEIARGTEEGDAERFPGEAEVLQAAIESMGNDNSDLLRPMPRNQIEALRAILTDADRDRLIDIGVTHIPTMTGTPWYAANARVAMVNRASPRAEYGERFLEFLASAAYNEQINETFDSICGVVEYCIDEDGISGPPDPLPGLEAFDSQIFVDAALLYANPDQVSPFIGRARQGVLAGEVMEWLQSRLVSPAEAAKMVEDRLNKQISANLEGDDQLRATWESIVGVEFRPGVNLREQVEAAQARVGGAS